MQKLTQERVRELFNCRDGKLIRRVRAGQNGCIGREAGYLRRDGYLQIAIDRRVYLAHRLVWLWHKGYLPEHGVDHIDRNSTNNRIENLREVSQSCNMRNTPNRATNTSGVKGVSCAGHQTGKWRVGILVRGRRVYLGLHTCFLEAVCHRLAAEQAENWEGCDSCSPAFRYVKEYLKVDK